ncbi:hypothetical protein HCN44_000332 [Aphidius gifuensis]|uniref:Tyr recombinase domain-containing protein n=1 Tax=Aphidius gifuensis TaxID=684658 RepID=A0A835CNR1_APHGI|nr:hypothetical protein HCN44_000332 [Aphidius gifuensis]
MANNVVPESDIDSDDDIPSEMRLNASKNFQNLLPGKSKEKYLSFHHEFRGWMDKNNIKSCDELILTVYFSYLQDEKKFMSSTLWSRWFMLKSTLSAYDNINVSAFKKLKAYLKKLNKGYKPKKSKILYSEDLAKFCIEADDKIHLANKVILIVGVFGACRRGELHNITFDEVEDSGKGLFISIPETKTDVARSFIITNDLYGICRKYMALRPTT